MHYINPHRPIDDYCTKIYPEPTNPKPWTNLDHVWDVILVTRSVKDGVPLLLCLKVRPANLDRDSLRPLLLVSIHDVSHVPSLTILLLGLSSDPRRNDIMLFIQVR